MQYFISTDSAYLLLRYSFQGSLTILTFQNNRFLKMQSDMKKADDNRPVVLFADDDEICLNVGVRMLEKLGYKVLEAKDGYEAVEIFERNREKVDLVILDMRMPNNGGTAFGQIKKIDANVKIMIASGYCEESRIRNLLKQGCQGFIQKPFTLDHLSKKVNTILEN